MNREAADMDEMFAKYLADELTDEERAALTESLDSDEEVQKAFADYMQWTSLIVRGLSTPEKVSDEAIQYAELASQRYLKLRPRRRWCNVARVASIAVGTLAAAAAIFVAFTAPRESTTPHTELTPSQLVLTKVLGDVRVSSASRKVKPGLGIEVGVTIETPREGRASLTYADGTSLEVGPGTSLRVASHQPKSIHLASGALEASVAPQPEGAPMSVSTDRARVEVLGTHFTAVASEDGSGVEVTSGSVKYVRVADGKALTIESGRSCVVAEGAQFKPIRLKVRALMAVARATVAQQDRPQQVSLVGERDEPEAPEPVPDAPSASDVAAGMVARFTFDEGRGNAFASGLETGPLAGIRGQIRTPAGIAKRTWSWTEGRFGKAIRFTPEFGDTREADHGAWGVVRVPAAHNPLYMRRDHSIAAWVKYTGPQHGDAVTTLVMQPGWINGLVRFRNSPVMVIFDKKGELPGAGWGTWLELGRWHHLVGVFDAGAAKIRLFIDGKPAATKSYAAPAPRQGTSAWYFGGRPDNVGPTECLLDEVRIYDRALTPEDAKTLYDWRP